MASMDPALQPVLNSLGQAPDDSQGALLRRVVWSLLALSSVFCLLRLYVKIRVSGRVFLDDVLIFIALLLGYAHAACIDVATKTGLGRHLIYIVKTGLDQFSNTMRVGLYSLAPGFMSPMFGRISFSIFLLWIIADNPRFKPWPIYVLIGVQIIINMASVVIFYSQCGNDLAIFWDLTRIFEVSQKCWNPHIQTYWGYAAGSINSLTDLCLTVIPALIVTYSKLTWRSRLGVMALLCLSSVAMIAAIKKTVEAKVLSQWVDFTYDLVPYIIWVSVELNIVIIASTIPVLRPLFKRQGISNIGRRKVEEGLDEEPGCHPPRPSLSKHFHRAQSSSISSQEKIIPSPPLHHFTITRTVEVYVSRGPRDRGLVHAALVGLPTE